MHIFHKWGKWQAGPAGSQSYNWKYRVCTVCAYYKVKKL